MKRHQHSPARHLHRPGFTLIELLVVIVIIGVLMSLILPAIGRVRDRAKVQETAAELTRLDTALAKFESDFGAMAYSELILTEDPAVSAWDSTTKTRLRRIWPQFTFTGQIDFNADGEFTGDGTSGATITLTGSEALVFFLAGVMTRNTANDPPTWIGFSRNPISPFTVAGANRVDPIYTFDPSRLVDLDGDGMMEYLDSLSGQKTPIHFTSSNNGQGYSTSVWRYVQADGRTPWNKDSYQLVSPGFDGELGFNPISIQTGLYVDGKELTGARRPEADNIANFKPGSTLGQ